MKKRPPRNYTMGARADEMLTTRERIVRAAMELALVQAYEDITLAAIAVAARVSHQTVLNYFQSKEGVAVAAAELLARETESARAAAVPGDAAGAIAVLVAEYERMGDANARWAMSVDRLGALAATLEQARIKHQVWLEQLFAVMLPRSLGARRRAICALHVATDVYAWKLLRRDLRLEQSEVETIMTGIVEAILAGSSTRLRARPRRP